MLADSVMTRPPGTLIGRLLSDKEKIFKVTNVFSVNNTATIPQVLRKSEHNLAGNSIAIAKAKKSD